MAALPVVLYTLSFGLFFIAQFESLDSFWLQAAVGANWAGLIAVLMKAAWGQMAGLLRKRRTLPLTSRRQGRPGLHAAAFLLFALNAFLWTRSNLPDALTESKTWGSVLLTGAGLMLATLAESPSQELRESTLGLIELSSEAAQSADSEPATRAS